MSKEADGLPEVPLFGECVLCYRAWRIDKQGRLWPINDWRTAWEPGADHHFVLTNLVKLLRTGRSNLPWFQHGATR
jgi:hypothetical protein